MLRGLVLAACLVSACAAQPPAEFRSPSSARDPDLALTTLAAAEPAAAPKRSRRIGRLSPPFSLGASARNVLARAPSDGGDRDLAAR
jgi:hypothetical protein